MSNTEPLMATWHNARTGEIVTRELTPEELAELEAFEQSPIAGM
jgi:hypothetical protein